MWFAYVEETEQHCVSSSPGLYDNFTFFLVVLLLHYKSILITKIQGSVYIYSAYEVLSFFTRHWRML